MEVSYRWLADFLDLTVSEEGVKEVSERLTMAGAEVEEFTYLESPSEIIAGKVNELSLHPEADNLFLAKVETESENLSVITAAENLYEGCLVPVIAAPGKLPNGQRIEGKKFRGEKSEGMLCSKEELGLEEKSTGIWILDESRHAIGDDLTNELEYDDYVLSFEITSNRPDLLSVIGIARELSVLTGKELKTPDPTYDPDYETDVEIEIENPDDTPRYTARSLKSVEIEPSPLRIQHRLAKIGLRPKNNVVDATNYTMIELGHPLHPFDLDRFKGNKINIRLAREGERLRTLDGEARELTGDNLVIADRGNPIALAGIMGGQPSEVTTATENVLLEGACFDRARIRKSAGTLGMTTDASKRFEKGMDPEATAKAINRVTELLQQERSFEKGSNLADNYPSPPDQKKVKLRRERAESLIGIELDESEIERTLTGLGIEVLERNEDELLTSPPSRRVDLAREIDLVEEVARIHGYDKIPETPPESGKVNLFSSKEERVIDRAKTLLTGLGLYETISPGFSLGERIHGDGEILNLKNPMGDKRSALRPDIGSSLLRHAEKNSKEGVDSISLFEIGKVFYSRDGKPDEANKLGLFLSGRRYEGVDGRESYNFWDLKGILEDFFAGLSISSWKLESNGPEFLHPGRKAELFLKGELLGFAGEIHPDRAEAYDLPDRAYLGEFDFAPIVETAEFEGGYEELPKFPSSSRDLSLTVPESIEESEIRETIIKGPKVE
ncbi:phenylalanine--tRNA ligase subunit beta, partial [Candidatus Bipolaricaulota bacterium]|nr:phenylalanine--tRNA ligase subunit beta [Candidatus Bipolaricaulota bacterium]